MQENHFGDFLGKKRREAELTQSRMAELLGVSAQTVSRWERGRAKPDQEALGKLSSLFRIPEDELLARIAGRKRPQITRIVLTGGPCAGKTTGLSWIQNAFSKLGYTVLFVPETATELINGGVTPWGCGTRLEYQRAQMQLQLEKERIYTEAAATMPVEKILIVCDRGTMDNRAYMSEGEFRLLMGELNTDLVQLRDRYDAVFHMVTAAKGAERFYTTENNQARTETPEEAAALDDKLISAWTGHPHLRVIHNSGSFEDKLKRLIGEISRFLGEPEPMEIDRKFLIEYPDVKWLESLPNCRKIDIIQTYLISREGEELRVRQRGENGSYVYYRTLKKKASGAARVEIEERLSQDAYLRLLMEADPTKRPIRKSRYCLTWEHHYFEIDVYPFWNDRAIVELELREESEQFRLPDRLKVIREVTDDESYQNASLAARNGE